MNDKELREKARLIAEQIKAGKSSWLDKLWSADYERRPVPVRQFVEDPFYLGDIVGNLAPVWKDALDEVFAPDSRIVVWLITGAIGAAKSTVAVVAHLYKVYCLSCLRSPAEFLGLFRESEIVFGLFSVTLKKSRSTDLRTMRTYVDSSPYFRKYLPRKPRTADALVFPSKNIRIELGSLERHALSSNLLGLFLDEANFFRHKVDKDSITMAHRIYEAARKRLVSRFLQGDILPGLITVVSSSNTVSDFTEEIEEKARVIPEFKETTKITRVSLWDAHPERSWGEEKIRVVVGDSRLESRVLEPDEIPPRGARIIEVPANLQLEFLLEPDQALRDLAGIPTVASSAFFPRLADITACVDHTRAHPFTVVEAPVGLKQGARLRELLIRPAVCKIVESRFQPLLDPGAQRFIHIDLAVNDCAAGFCMGHPIRLRDGRLGVCLDMILRIVAPSGDEINFEAITDLVCYLRDLGYPIARITFDQFQSRMPMQILRTAGFNAERLSIKLAHYNALKDSILNKRLQFYRYKPLIEELRGLRRPADKNDRPEGEPDDVADAVAGVVAQCLGVSGVRRSHKRELDDKQPRTGLTFPVLVKGV